MDLDYFSMGGFRMRYLCAVILSLLLATSAFGREIRLTCDPYPADSLITHFIVEKDGAPWVPESVPKVLADGSFVLWETVTSLPSGDHTFTVKAVSGLDTSEASDPFVWRRRIPSKPALIISVGD